MPYTVFPLHALRADGTCACSKGAQCARPGKHPAVRWGDLEPGARVLGPAGHGIVTGVKSGIFVIDTDGAEADARFRARGEVPATYTVRTPSGGRHYYFVHPGFPVRSSVGEFDWREHEIAVDEATGRTIKVSTKIDVRGDPGIVVVPGSPHRSGRAYEVENSVPPAPAPEWLLSWPGLRGRELAASEGAWRPFPVDVSTDLGQRRVAMGREACATMTPSVQGEDGSGALWNLALRLVRDLELPIDTCDELVTEIFNARCSPPWDPEEIEHKLIDARDKSDRPPGMVTDIDVAKFSAPLRAPERTGKPRRKPSPEHHYSASIKDVGIMQPTKTTLGKVLDILSGNVPEWEGVLQYDAFRDRIVAVDPPIKLEAEKTCFVEHDTTAVRSWFEKSAGLLVSKDTAWDAVISVARENTFHPVREYLADLPPGDPSDLDIAARVFFGSDDDLDRVLVRKFLVGAVRRILRPGEKVDTMLVLFGIQGAGKSTFVPALFGESFASEDLADIRTKDAMIGLAGKWAIEVAELDKLLRTDPETVKAFVSRCVDPYRAPYERVSTDHPRQCVYVGTTNKDDFLRDPTGERRYWIVRADKVDLDAVRAWRDRLFAAAYVVAQRDKYDEPHWLVGDEIERLKTRAALYKGEHGWTDSITSYCIGREYVKVEDVYKHLGGTVDKLDDPRRTTKITDILRDLGCEKGIKAEGRLRLRVWYVPELLRTAEVPATEAHRRAGENMIQGILKPGVSGTGNSDIPTGVSAE